MLNISNVLSEAEYIKLDQNNILWYGQAWYANKQEDLKKIKEIKETLNYIESRGWYETKIKDYKLYIFIPSLGRWVDNNYKQHVNKDRKEVYINNIHNAAEMIRRNK